MSDRPPPRPAPHRAPPPPQRVPLPLDRATLVPTIGADGATRPRPLPSVRGGGFVSVRDLGAVGDGRRHPLRQSYPTLEAARADFPHATDLSDEIDWAATQGAIDRAAAMGGGTVVAPAGTYVCNRTLTFPEAREFGERGRQVNWLGEGMMASVYRWPDDLGAGRFAVLCPRRLEADGMYEGFWQDLGLEGPDPAPALGTTRAAMHGWGWGARRRMTRCGARGFRAALDIVGDHARFEDVTCRDSLYGIYFSTASRHLFGDLVFEKCMISGCSLAAIAVAADSEMGGCTLLGCYVGGAPYALMKEAGPGRDVLVSNTLFVNAMFEYLGNGWLHDANQPRRAVARNVTFDTCFVLWADRNRLRAPGHGRAALWDLHRAEHVRWVTIKEPHGAQPGDEALLKVNYPLGCEITGHVGALVDNCARAGKPLLHRTAAGHGAHRFLSLSQNGEWRGHCELLAEGDGAARPGDVLEWAAGGRVRRGREGPAPVAGICLSATAPDQLAVVATAGASLHVRSPARSADALFIKGPDGTAVPSPSPAPAPSAVVGWAHHATPEGVGVARGG